MDLQSYQDLGTWAYLLLALLVMVEGPVATLAGSVAASAGLMKPIWVFLSAASGNILADTLWYTVGYLGKMEWLHRYGSWFGLKESLVIRFQKDIQTHATKLLLVAKLSLGFIIPALVATGLARVPIRRWLWALLLGETLWTGLLVVTGFHFGQYVQRLERGVEIVALVGAALFVALVVFYISHLRRRSVEMGGADSDR